MEKLINEITDKYDEYSIEYILNEIKNISVLSDTDCFLQIAEYLNNKGHLENFMNQVVSFNAEARFNLTCYVSKNK